MVAAEITPTSVQLMPVVSHKHSGTPMRIEEYLVKFTKVTQNDWVVVEDIMPGTFISVEGGYTIETGGDGVEETNTYTSSGTKITATSTTVGTTYLMVRVSR